MLEGRVPKLLPLNGIMKISFDRKFICAGDRSGRNGRWGEDRAGGMILFQEQNGKC